MNQKELKELWVLYLKDSNKEMCSQIEKQYKESYKGEIWADLYYSIHTIDDLKYYWNLANSITCTELANEIDGKFKRLHIDLFSIAMLM